MSLKRTKLYIFGGNAVFSNKSIVKNHLALKSDCSDGRNGILNFFHKKYPNYMNTRQINHSVA